MSHPQRKWNEDEVIRELQTVDTPEPPADLLQEIYGEIPNDLFPPENEVWLAPKRNPYRTWFAAAAMLAVAVTGGWLAMRTMETAESPTERLASEEQSSKDRPTRSTQQAPAVAGPVVADKVTVGEEEVLRGAPGKISQGMRTETEGAGVPVAPSSSTVRSKRVPVPDPTPEIDDLAFALPPQQEQDQRLDRSARDQDTASRRPSGHQEPSRLRRESADLEAQLRSLQKTREGEVRSRAPGVAEPTTAEAGHQAAEKKEAVTFRGGSPGQEVALPPPPPAASPPPPAPRAAHRRLAEVPKPTAVVAPTAPPSTGGTAEPNDQPYGDVFFEGAGTNPFIDTEDDRLSTFGFDVDTGSYTVVRRFLSDGNLPPNDAVRVEEFINAFDYGDRPPRRGDFALHAEGAPSPFAHGERYYLLRLNAQGRVIHVADRKPALLTFVVDVSGSMAREDRLGLVKQSLAMLLDQLRRDDQVALVVFGSNGRVLLPPTSDHFAIRQAVNALHPEGATNAEEGLALGYEIAARNAREGMINRVILCSDGVANVGRTGPDSILERIRRGTEEGIELTTLGFGMGNYNDVLMEQLADQGDGRYAYIDTLDEAHRVLVEELTGTLQTIASEARAQVEFNPQVVERYRLIGYENRDIADHRFRDDTVDAGEIGAGHSVTALYEVKLAEGYEPGDRRREVAVLNVRYRSAQSGRFEEERRSITLADFAERWERATPALRLTTLVAEFGEILKGSYWARGSSLDEVFRRTQALSGDFAGDREVAELVALMGRASRLASTSRED